MVAWPQPLLGQGQPVTLRSCRHTGAARPGPVPTNTKEGLGSSPCRELELPPELDKAALT